MTKGLKKYLKKKVIWFIITFVAAVILNFILPRLMPGDPVDLMMDRKVDVAKKEAMRIQYGFDKPLPDKTYNQKYIHGTY